MLKKFCWQVVTFQTVVLAALVVVASESRAHVPPYAGWRTGGQGGGTQNVVAGPIKRRPVTSDSTNGQILFWPPLELKNTQPSGPANPNLNVTAIFIGP